MNKLGVPAEANQRKVDPKECIPDIRETNVKFKHAICVSWMNKPIS